MQKTITRIAIIILLFVILLLVKSVVFTKEMQQNSPSSDIAEFENVDVVTACNSALAYMSFMNGEDADAFIEACLQGGHPEVIERYIKTNEGISSYMENPIIEPLITVIAPQENAIVTNPITVSGTARGYWFFEATAPVDVYNEGGVIIGQGYVTATEPWMTKEFISFTGTITFEENMITSGEVVTLVFNRANPSGIPDNAESASVNLIVE